MAPAERTTASATTRRRATTIPDTGYQCMLELLAVVERALGARSERRAGVTWCPPRACSTVLRRFAGPEADELAILCRPEGPSPDAPARPRRPTGRWRRCLAAHQASFRDLACETLFLRDIRRDLPLVLDVRARVLADLGQSAGAPPPAFIQQAPLDRRRGLRARGVGRGPAPIATPGRCATSRPTPSCACEGCARSGCTARSPRRPDLAPHDERLRHRRRCLRAGREHVPRGGAPARPLRHGVPRRRPHLDPPARHRPGLRRAEQSPTRVLPAPRHRAAARQHRRPGHAVSRRARLLHEPRTRCSPPRPLDVTPMSTPTAQRGVELRCGLLARPAGRRREQGGALRLGNREHRRSGADRPRRATSRRRSIACCTTSPRCSPSRAPRFANLVSGVTYLKNPSDAPVLRAMCRERGFDGFPCALVEAPLCRPELLCETEAVAMLPLAPAAA